MEIINDGKGSEDVFKSFVINRVCQGQTYNICLYYLNKLYQLYPFAINSLQKKAIKMNYN